MTTACKQKSKESGHRFQINCVKNDIIRKESRGDDASYERGLLKSWGEYPGWEYATDALASLGKSKSSPLEAQSNGIRPAGAK